MLRDSSLTSQLHRASVQSFSHPTGIATAKRNACVDTEVIMGRFVYERDPGHELNMFSVAQQTHSLTHSHSHTHITSRASAYSLR